MRQTTLAAIDIGTLKVKLLIARIDKAFTTMSTMSKHLDAPHIIPSNANISQGIIYSMI